MTQEKLKTHKPRWFLRTHTFWSIQLATELELESCNSYVSPPPDIATTRPEAVAAGSYLTRFLTLATPFFITGHLLNQDRWSATCNLKIHRDQRLASRHLREGFSKDATRDLWPVTFKREPCKILDLEITLHNGSDLAIASDPAV